MGLMPFRARVPRPTAADMPQADLVTRFTLSEGKLVVDLADESSLEAEGALSVRVNGRKPQVSEVRRFLRALAQTFHSKTPVNGAERAAQARAITILRKAIASSHNAKRRHPT